MSVKTAVLVSGGGTNLQALLDASGRGELPHADLCLVISSNPDAYALTRARNAGVEAVCIARKGMAQDVFEDQLLSVLKAHGIAMVILAGFMSILSERVIRAYPGAILNVHPSLIPAFCGKGYYGLRVHEAALKRGVKVTGCTVHIVNEIPDGGPILAQKAIEILEDDTPETLQRRVMEQCEWKLLPACAEQVACRLEANP